MRDLWRNGFKGDSAEGISVPEPLGTVPALGRWLQRRVPGTVATTLLTTTAAAPVARRIAEAAHKLHHAGVVPEKTHGPAEELAILDRVLAEVRATRPETRAAIDHLLACCRRLVATLDGPVTGIHRDLYADQIVVDGTRLHLLDFDLYCAGHAALDVGNVAGHLMEQRVREPEHAAALACAHEALDTQYVRLAGDAARHPLRVYTALTLARHVYLSTVIPGRAATTGAVLDQTLTCMEALLDGRA